MHFFAILMWHYLLRKLTAIVNPKYVCCKYRDLKYSCMPNVCRTLIQTNTNVHKCTDDDTTRVSSRIKDWMNATTNATIHINTHIQLCICTWTRVCVCMCNKYFFVVQRNVICISWLDCCCCSFCLTIVYETAESYRVTTYWFAVVSFNNGTMW